MCCRNALRQHVAVAYHNALLSRLFEFIMVKAGDRNITNMSVHMCTRQVYEFVLYRISTKKGCLSYEKLPALLLMSCKQDSVGMPLNLMR